MESTFLSLGINVDDIYLYGIITGMLFGLFNGLIDSIINYLNNKAWIVNDYERIIDKYTYLDDAEDNVEFEIISNAKISHKKRLLKIEKREKFLNKFRKK